jgi:hypothetical protein
MKISLEKASGRAYCRGAECKSDPKFISDSLRIKSGTTCVAISMSSAGGYNTSYYCRDCVDKLYEDMKKILNPALWIFH